MKKKAMAMAALMGAKARSQTLTAAMIMIRKMGII
jgi:hypothetical protein